MKPPRLVEDGDVRRDRDEALGDALDAREVEQRAPEGRLGRRRGRVAARQRRRHARRRRPAPRSPRSSRRARRRRAARPRGVSAAIPVPLGLGRQAHRLAEAVDLVAVEQRGVVLRPAGDLEAVALDRVGEDHRRPVGRLARLPQRAEHVREVVAAEVAHERRHLAAVGVEQPLAARRAPSPSSAVEHASSRTTSSRRAEERLVLLVRHLVDPAPQQVAAVARVRLAQPAPVLELDHVPAVRARTAPPARPRGCPGMTRSSDCRLRSTIQSTFAEPARQRLGERLPDVPLVELGVAEQRDEAAARRGAEARLR